MQENDDDKSGVCCDEGILATQISVNQQYTNT